MGNKDKENKIHYLFAGAGFLAKYTAKRIIDDYIRFKKDEGQKLTITFVDINLADTGVFLSLFPPLKRVIEENDLNNDPNFKINYQWHSLGDPESLDGLIDDVDHIIYTAAIADVPLAMKSPNYTYYINVTNTQTFLNYLKSKKFTGKFIMLSSESVYGHFPPNKLPLKEDYKPDPINIYGSSKLAQEQLPLTHHHWWGLNAVVLRSATMYGPYGRVKQAIPIFLGQALENKPITLDGDGSNSRDFVYVEDTARAIQMVLSDDVDVKKIAGQIINIGSGKETDFKSLINQIRVMVFGKKIVGENITKEDVDKYAPIMYRPFRAGEEGLRVKLDISKAKRLLNYAPVYEFHSTNTDYSGLLHALIWRHKTLFKDDVAGRKKLFDGTKIDFAYQYEDYVKHIQGIEEKVNKLNPEIVAALLTAMQSGVVPGITPTTDGSGVEIDVETPPYDTSQQQSSTQPKEDKLTIDMSTIVPVDVTQTDPQVKKKSKKNKK